jgi:hypothetical protein
LSVSWIIFNLRLIWPSMSAQFSILEKYLTKLLDRISFLKNLRLLCDNLIIMHITSNFKYSLITNLILK